MVTDFVNINNSSTVLVIKSPVNTVEFTCLAALVYLHLILDTMSDNEITMNNHIREPPFLPYILAGQGPHFPAARALYILSFFG